MQNFWKLFFLVIIVGFTACGGSSPGRPVAWSAPEVVVAASAFAGVHGLAIDAKGRLLAASNIGSNITEVDRTTGATKVFIPAPDGSADDITVGPNGELAWTALLQGEVRYRASDTAPIRVLASGMAGVNSPGFDRRNGKLYVAQTFSTDTLWEIDVTGTNPPRLIAKDLGALNGFDVGPDGMIYGPLVHKGQVAKIDPSNGTITVINSEFKSPNGVKLDGKGNLWVADIFTGQLSKVALATGVKTMVKQLNLGVDNIAIAPNGVLYVSNLAYDTIESYDPATDDYRVLVPGKLSVPGAIKLDGDSLFIADFFALRQVNARSGAVADLFIQDAVIPNLAFPTGVGVSAKQLALSSWFSGTVQVVDRATMKFTDTITGFTAPIDALFLSDGSLVIADFGTGTIIQASGTGFKDRKVIAQGLSGPVQMILGQDGNLYVTETVGNLTRISLPNGGKTVIASGLAQPEGVTQTPWGSFIVAEVEARTLVEIDVGGTRRTIAENLPFGLAAPQGLPSPYIISGVAVGADGTIYFSADRNGNGAIHRIKPVR